MIVNCEAGGFSKIPQGEFDRRIDIKSANPGDPLYEKMASGAYLGSVIYEAVLQGAKDGLFSADFCERVQFVRDFSLSEVDAFMRDMHAVNTLSRLCAKEADREMTYAIAEACMDRAAKLVCAQLSGCLMQADCGTSPDEPACIVAEGSTILKSLFLRPRLEQYMRQFTTQSLHRWYRFVSAEHTNLVGAATAAALNC